MQKKQADSTSLVKIKKNLDHTGLEPVTSRLSSVRSNQLS